MDTFSSYAFGFLHASKQPEAAVSVLHNDVLPFYRELDLPIGAVLTDNGREFCGTDAHPFELYLALNGIEHRRTRVRTPKANGFVERFNGTVLDEFFRSTMRETFYRDVDSLQTDLDSWLRHYNYERPHLGYRNQGRRPGIRFVSSSAKKLKRTRHAHDAPHRGGGATPRRRVVEELERRPERQPTQERKANERKSAPALTCWNDVIFPPSGTRPLASRRGLQT